MEKPSNQALVTEQGYHHTFTVFTPTYNRDHTLHRVYKSLKLQTYRDFEWLIVDDGSTDNTRNLVEEWKKIANFPIRYIYQNNTGKNTAYNLGAREAKGKFLLCLDSDDACVPEALARFKYHWETIPENEQEQFSGVDCLCQDSSGNVVGSYYPASPIDSNYAEMRYRYQVTGEKWGFQRTEVMRQFPFPEVPGLILGNLVWSSMTKKYKARYVNECLRVYYTDSGADQLSKSGWKPKNSLSLFLAYKSTIDNDLDYFRFLPAVFLRSAANYSRYCFHLKTDIKQQFINLNSRLARVLWLITLPLGYLLWSRDKLKT